MFPYPVFLDFNTTLFSFEIFLEMDDHTDMMGGKPSARSDTVDEFRGNVAKGLSSPSVVSTAQGLIARVSEKSALIEAESEEASS
jgi:hypothetical protein